MCGLSQTKAGKGTLSSTGSEENPHRKGIYMSKALQESFQFKKVADIPRILVFGRRHRSSEVEKISLVVLLRASAKSHAFVSMC